MPRHSHSLSYHTTHCMALMDWVRRHAHAMPALNSLVYIPNDAKRTRAAAGIAKAMGLKAGVWDYLLAYPGVHYNGLWIEFKSPSDKLSPEQSWWGELMRANNYATHVSREWPNAVEVLRLYIAGRDWEQCWQ